MTETRSVRSLSEGSGRFGFVVFRMPMLADLSDNFPFRIIIHIFAGR